MPSSVLRRWHHADDWHDYRSRHLHGRTVPGKAAAEDAITAEFRFDIGFMAERLLAATHGARRQLPDLSVGYFGASTGAAAALAAATQAQHLIGAIVSRGAAQIWPAEICRKSSHRHC
jgi:hypothetical protein